jgi:hypothetical protein
MAEYLNTATTPSIEHIALAIAADIRRERLELLSIASAALAIVAAKEALQ